MYAVLPLTVFVWAVENVRTAYWGRLAPNTIALPRGTYPCLPLRTQKNMTLFARLLFFSLLAAIALAFTPCPSNDESTNQFLGVVVETPE